MKESYRKGLANHPDPELTQGLNIAMFFSRTYTRLLRPGLAEISDPIAPAGSALRSAFDRIHSAIDQRCEDLKLAA